MANWDIFHSDRLEVERNLTPAAVRAGIARGEIGEDDLVRPAGSTDPWARLADHPGLTAALAGDQAIVNPPTLQALVDDDEDEDDRDLSRFVIDKDLEEGDTVEKPTISRPGPAPTPAPTPPPRAKPTPSRSAPPPLPGSVPKATTDDLDPLAYDSAVTRDFDLNLRPKSQVVMLEVDEDNDAYDPDEEDEEAAEFTFTRQGADTVEELDLAAMVDVAFQLVLFFLVTASTVIFKTLEVPKPNPEQGKGVATQGSGRTLDDLQKDYILVEIDPSGGLKIDHETLSDARNLVNKLRDLRQNTGRTAMLMTADSATLHKYAVMAYDAANEIGLKIAIAQPKATPAPAPVPPVGP